MRGNLGLLAVEMKDVSFSYTEGVQTLRNVSFEIEQGEYVCILGHNGSGKSTISKILVGLLKPSRGTLKIFGKEMNYLTLKEIRNDVGIVFQNPDNQFIGMTAEDDIAFGLENRKYKREKMVQIIKNVAQRINITNLLKIEPTKLSGGQKQRVAIAGVLAFDPRIIIFDESTSMLDPKGKMELKKTILDLKNENDQKTIISITHDMEEVHSADKVIIMYRGEVQRVGTPQEVFSDPKFVARMKLDLPFNLRLSSKLNETNKKIKPTISSKKLLESLGEKI